MKKTFSSKLIHLWIKEGKFDRVKKTINVNRKKSPEARFLSDIASGFNQNRRGYRTFLELAIDGNPLHIVATTEVRITRTGFALIKWIIAT
jgi:predicted site-specific integrase-resolvase